MARNAQILRETKETEVEITCELDGTGLGVVATGLGFFDHMLDLFSKHGLFDMTVRAKGDIEVDMHHTIEDVGIVLGSVTKDALGDKVGIRRVGFCSLPMDEALVNVSLDISGRGRGLLFGEIPSDAPIPASLVEGFIESFAANLGATIHVEVVRGKDAHHCIEAIFKGLARALRVAVEIDPRVKDVPSTKGSI